MEELKEILIPVATALAAFITAKLTPSKKQAELQSELQEIKSKIDDSDKVYYVKCPKCRHKIYLSKVTIYAEEKQEAK